jgi:hypothetical protein
MLRNTLLLAAVVASASPAAAQLDFDVISFGKIQVDDATLGLSSGWLLLVNTGSVPLSLLDWQKALHFAEFSVPVGGFDVKPVFSGPTTLAPGEAIGAFDPALVNLLEVGESYTMAASTQFSLSTPWPAGTTQSVRWRFEFAGREVSGVTEVEFTSTPVGFGLTGLRTPSVPVTPSITSLPSSCSGALTVRPLGLASPFRIAPSSNLPVLGNQCFGLDVRTNNQPYLLGLDLAPGTGTFAGCDLRLALSPTLRTLSGAGIAQRLAVPNQAALLGQHVWLQAAALSGGSVTSLTNGLELVLSAKP